MLKPYSISTCFCVLVLDESAFCELVALLLGCLTSPSFHQSGKQQLLADILGGHANLYLWISHVISAIATVLVLDFHAMNILQLEPLHQFGKDVDKMNDWHLLPLFVISLRSVLIASIRSAVFITVLWCGRLRSTEPWRGTNYSDATQTSSGE